MPDDKKIPFDYLGAKKAGYSDSEIQSYLKDNYAFQFDIVGAKNSGYSDKEIADYITAYEAPVKKKEAGVLGSLVGAMAGSGGGKDGLSEEEKIARDLKTVGRSRVNEKAVGIQIDENDPVKSYLTPLRNRRKEIFDSNIKIESTGQNRELKKKIATDEVNSINQTEAEIRNHLFPSTVSAEYWLKEHPASEDNETSRIALEVVNEKNKAFHSIKNNPGSFKGAAIDYFTNKGGKLGEQLRVMRESGAAIPHQLEGNLVYEFSQLRPFKELPDSHPVKQQAEIEMRDLFTTYPELMQQNILSKIAQGMEDFDMNNAFANFPGVHSSDKVIEELDKQGKLTEAEKDFYTKYTRPMIGVGAADIPTPGLIENTLKSTAKAIEDAPKSVYEATGLRNLLFSKGEILSRDLEEDLAKTPEPKYKGWLKNVTHATGSLAGIVIPIGVEAKLLQGFNLVNKASTAHKLATGLTFYHDIEKAERQNNPDNPLLNHLSALIQTGVWMQGGQVFGNISKGIIRNTAPEINTILKSLEKGEINNALAAKSIAETVTEKIFKVAGNSISASGQVAGYTMINKTVSGILNGDADFSGVAEEGVNTFTHMMMGMPLFEILKIPGSKNMTADYINEIASHPEIYRNKLTTPEQKKNFEFLVSLKETLPDNLTTEQKKKYQLAALQKKILENEIEKSPDKDLIRKHGEQVRAIEAEKEKILENKIDQDRELEMEGGIVPEEIIVQQAKEGKLMGGYSELVNQNPETAKEVLLDYARQKYGVSQDGAELDGGGREITNKEVDTAVTQAYPTKESLIAAMKPAEQQPSGVEGGDVVRDKSKDVDYGDEGWANTGTKFNKGKFSAKDGNDYMVVRLGEGDKFELLVKDKNNETVGAATFKKDSDGAYSASEVSSDIPSIGLARAMYDFVDSKIGQVTKSASLSGDGMELWKRNNEFKYSQSKEQPPIKDEKLAEDKDTLLVAGIQNVSKNQAASTLLKVAMNRGVIPERQYNDFGKELAAVKVTPKSKTAIADVAEIIQKYSDAKNEKTDSVIKEANQAIDNAEFERRAYADMTPQEKFEAVIEDKAATSEKLTPEELKFVNENYFAPKGYRYNENFELVKSKKVKDEKPINQEAEGADKRVELEAERDMKVREALKPELEIKFKTADDIKGMAKGNPKEFKRIAKEQGGIKKKFKQLESIIDCLWAKN